jgi:26S proteasome regulatory subunit N8
VIYLSSLIRSIISLHNLLNNKLSNRALEQEKRDAIAAASAEKADKAAAAAASSTPSTATKDDKKDGDKNSKK